MHSQKYFRIRLIILYFFLACNLFAQIEFKVDYQELAIIPEITPSGIYGLINWGIDNNKLFIFDRNNRTVIYDLQNKISVSSNSGEEYTLDESFGIHNFSKSDILFKNPDGYYSNQNNESLRIIRGRDDVNLQFDGREITINYNSDFVEPIGIDSDSRIFLYSESIVRHFPLEVIGNILILNEYGEILKEFQVPFYNYLTISKRFEIDRNGIIYHFISTPNYLALNKFDPWANNVLQKEYEIKNIAPVHYSEYVSIEEYSPEYKPGDAALIFSSRKTALSLAEDYVTYKYLCVAGNLAPNNVTAPDGDIVRTPSWLITGWNGKVAYKWGGFNTISSYYSGLINNRYAGDINTAGVSSYAVGVDCSGFVSRCWQLSYHSSTSMMPDITVQYASWNDLKPGDAIHKIGHVRLFINREPNGSFRIAEASARDWAVSYWSYTPSDLLSYTPRYYSGMENLYSDVDVKLIRARYTDDGDSVNLKWFSEMTGIKGFRIYSSNDGKSFNAIFDENSVNTPEYSIPAGIGNYFKITAVSESDGAESFFSNTLGITRGTSERKWLIVDGFDRNLSSASWHGKSHNFTIPYFKVLSTGNETVETIHHSDLTNTASDYTGIYWIAGDESTTDTTLDNYEKEFLRNYLRNGGNLFISGSEIGWDLYQMGDNDDKDFYRDYLKSKFVSDDSNSKLARGIIGTPFAAVNLYFGQMYDEDFPDAIDTVNGSIPILTYSTNKTAAIAYRGLFPQGNLDGSLIYLGFPPETSANDSAFAELVQTSYNYFLNISKTPERLPITPKDFVLYNNYPNPFNPETNLSFYLNSAQTITIDLLTMLGEKIKTIYSGTVKEGFHSFRLSSFGLSSGIYFVNYTLNNKFYSQKIILTK